MTAPSKGRRADEAVIVAEVGPNHRIIQWPGDRQYIGQKRTAAGHWHSHIYFMTEAGARRLYDRHYRALRPLAEATIALFADEVERPRPAESPPAGR